VERIAWRFILVATATNISVPIAAQTPTKPEYMAVVDYAAPPETISGLVRSADAVVRVSVRQSHAFTDSQAAHSTPMTRHDCVILQTFKRFEGLPADGSIVEVLEHAGAYETATARVRTTEAIHLVAQGEYVLFLQWNRHFNAFELIFGPAGIYRIVGPVIETFFTSKVGASQHGRPTSDLLMELAQRP